MKSRSLSVSAGTTCRTTLCKDNFKLNRFTSNKWNIYVQKQRSVALK